MDVRQDVEEAIFGEGRLGSRMQSLTSAILQRREVGGGVEMGERRSRGC